MGVLGVNFSFHEVDSESSLLEIGIKRSISNMGRQPFCGALPQRMVPAFESAGLGGMRQEKRREILDDHVEWPRLHRDVVNKRRPLIPFGLVVGNGLGKGVGTIRWDWRLAPCERRRDGSGQAISGNA